MIIKNEKGEEVEVFSKEEADALAEKKAQEAQEAKDAEIQKLQKEKEEKEAELKKLQDKDYNFEQLRKKADKGGATEDEVKSQIEELNKRLDQVATQPITETLNDFIREEVGEDKERKEKFDYYYKRLGAEAKTKDEVLRAAKEALTLATDGEYKADGSNRITGTGVGQNYRGGDGQPRKRGDDFGDIAKAMGNTEDDIKKYGGQS